MAVLIVVDVTPEGFGLEGLISAFVVVGNDRVALIDPGPEGSRPKLKARLEELGLKPDIVIATHIHLDHGGSVGGLLSEDYPNAIAYVHPRGVKHLVDPSKLWDASKAVLGPIADVYAKPVPAPPERLHAAPDGLSIDLGGAVIEVVHTPGHASHHMSLLLKPDSILFTGDSAGVIVKVPPYPPVTFPTTPPPFKPELYMDSLNRMISLKPSKVAPTHFGLHEGGYSYLQAHKRQVELWLTTLSEAETDDVDEAAAILASVDENVSRVLGVPDLRFLKTLFLDASIAGFLDAIKGGRGGARG